MNKRSLQLCWNHQIGAGDRVKYVWGRRATIVVMTLSDGIMPPQNSRLIHTYQVLYKNTIHKRKGLYIRQWRARQLAERSSNHHRFVTWVVLVDLAASWLLRRLDSAENLLALSCQWRKMRINLINSKTTWNRQNDKTRPCDTGYPAKCQKRLHLKKGVFFKAANGFLNDLGVHGDIQSSSNMERPWHRSPWKSQ